MKVAQSCTKFKNEKKKATQMRFFYKIILLVQQINQKTNQMFVRISALASKKGQIKKNSLESVFLVNLVTPKEYFENNHNFLDFGHSKKFFTNLEMADRVKINGIKRFDEI